MNDNLSSSPASAYDRNIPNLIPYYEEIHEQILDLIAQMSFEPLCWLDTGCGTGTLAEKICSCFCTEELVLCDPSRGMLDIAKNKLKSHQNTIQYYNCSSGELSFQEHFQVVTSIQSHHYLDKTKRQTAIKKCRQALCKEGVYITFENTRPFTETGLDIEFKRAFDYKTKHGFSSADALKHQQRFDSEYFPLTITEHLNLLRECGFRHVEVLWHSYMQSGFYAIK